RHRQEEGPAHPRDSRFHFENSFVCTPAPPFWRAIAWAMGQCRKPRCSTTSSRIRRARLPPGRITLVGHISGDRMRDSSYLIREYPLQQGALEIAYIEEYFNEFPKRKTATEIVERLAGRQFQILMAEAPVDDGATVVPVSYKVSHELREQEVDPKLADLVDRL